MSFRGLNQFAASVAAGFFSGDADGQVLCAWITPGPADKPGGRPLYSLEITENVHRGPVRRRHRDLLGAAVAEETTASVHLLLADPPEGMPYLPIKHETTLLVGYDQESAEAYRIVDFEELGGRLELQLEKFAL